MGLPIAGIHDTVSVAEEKMPEQAPASDWQAACEARLRSARLEPSWHHPSRRMEGRSPDGGRCVRGEIPREPSRDRSRIEVTIS